MTRHCYNKKRAGFTSAELLVALMVCAVVFTAVASLAYALNSASRSTEDMSAHQMALRCATVRITELVKHSVMAFGAPSGGIALWTGDENADGLINGSELVYIETDAAGHTLRLLYFPDQNLSVAISDIQAGNGKTDLVAGTDERYINLLPQCSNVQLALDGTSTFVNIMFDLTENNTTTTYQICATLRCSATSADGGDDD